jgi:hypothetical protein
VDIDALLATNIQYVLSYQDWNLKVPVRVLALVFTPLNITISHYNMLIVVFVISIVDLDP